MAAEKPVVTIIPCRRRSETPHYVNILNSAALIIAFKHVKQPEYIKKNPPTHIHITKLHHTAHSSWNMCLTIRRASFVFVSASTSRSAVTAEGRIWAMKSRLDVSFNRTRLYNCFILMPAMYKQSLVSNLVMVCEQFSWYSLIVLEAAMQELSSKTAYYSS